MKKTLFLLVSLIYGIASAEVQQQGTEEKSKVVGPISDGVSSPQSPTPPLPNYKIHWAHVQHKKDHKVTINRVEPPAKPAQPVVDQLTAEQILERDRILTQQLAGQKPSGGTFFVFASSYDGQATRVRWKHGGEEYIAWSNVDWKYLCGFTGFEGRGKRYNLLLLHGSSQAPGQTKMAGLPSLETAGARYTVTKGDEGNEEAMEFIEAIHDLYAAEQVRLIAAYHERQKNWKIQQLRNAELRKTPPPKPDVIINYWKRHTPVNPNKESR